MTGETTVLQQREQGLDWATAQLFDEPRAAGSESRQADRPSPIDDLPAQLKELCAADVGIPRERAVELKEAAIAHTRAQEEKEVVEASLRRVAEDLGPEWAQSLQADKITPLELVQRLYAEGASIEAIQRCLRGEIAAQTIQDSYTARKRAVGFPDDAPVQSYQLRAEEKLQREVTTFLTNWAEKVTMAEREPDLTYHDPLVVTIGNIPFSEWRVRPFGWLAAVPLLFELPPPIEKERAELTPYSWTVSGGREASALAGQTRCSLIRSVLQRGVELKTVTPEKADKIRQGLYESFDDCNLNLDCYEKAQPIAVCLAESILQRGLKVKTVTPENADRIRAISDGYDRYLATQPIDRATGQKTRYLAESVLQRGLELKTITSEDADRIRAISDSYDRYFATQSIADCLAESVLQRGLELKTVTPEDADRIRAISDGYDRYLATQPIAVANERKTDDCEGGPQLNSRLKCTLKNPEPSSTQSPVLQRFFAEIRERGCEPVATVEGMNLSLTFRLRVS